MNRNVLFLFLAATYALGCGALDTLGFQEDDDPKRCDTNELCEIRTCQRATTCVAVGEEPPTCGYQNLDDGIACDLPSSQPGANDGICLDGICAQRDGPQSCDASAECEARQCQEATTCVTDDESAPQCGYQNLSDDSACDLAGSVPGSNDGICDSGLCVVPGPQICTANGGCGVGESCVGGFCAPRGGGGEACDALDHEDCQSGFVCEASSQTCQGEIGTSCTDDAQCLNRCIQGSCDEPGEIGEGCDGGQNEDCQSPLICAGDNTCRLPEGESCSANSECAQTCVEGVCQPPAEEGGQCDHGDDVDCATGTCPYGICGGGLRGQAIIVEVRGYYASTGATLSEIQAFDVSDNPVTLSTNSTDAYDLAKDDLPYYWNLGNWDRSNLFDGDTGYADGPAGADSSAIFMHRDDTGGVGSPNDTEWARFAVYCDAATTIHRMRLALGSPERRIPYEVTFYLSPSFDAASQIVGRDNTALIPLWTVFAEDTAEWQIVRWEEKVF